MCEKQIFMNKFFHTDYFSQLLFSCDQRHIHFSKEFHFSADNSFFATDRRKFFLAIHLVCLEKFQFSVQLKRE